MLVAVVIFAVFGAVFSLIVLKMQTMLAFPHIPPSAQIPDAVHASGGEVIWLDVDGERVESWFLPARQPGRQYGKRKRFRRMPD
jgi:hypothetical protein